MPRISPENTEREALDRVMTPALRADLDRALDSLSERRRDIFVSHFVDHVPYRELSIHYGITEKRAEQIARSAQTQLKSVTSLRQYLDMIG